MGQLYTKLNQLVMNDVETAADPDRPREKLETAFITPARPFRLPDPRSATQFIDRTPIIVNADTVSSADTPKAPKIASRPRYLETDLDDVLPDSADVVQTSPDALQTSAVQHSGISTMTTSTPVHHIKQKARATFVTAQGIIDDVITKAVEQVSELRFSDTGVCEVVTSERSTSTITSGTTVSVANQGMLMSSGSYSERVSFGEEVKSLEGRELSYAEEVVILPEDVEQISCVDDVVEVILEEGCESLVANWSGIGGPDRSVGIDADLAPHNVLGDRSMTDIGQIVEDWVLNQQSLMVPENQTTNYQDESSVAQDASLINQQSDSLIVHNSESFENHSGDLEWDDSLFVSSPHVRADAENCNAKNIYVTPKKKSMLTTKPGGRTPLGDVSTNSPVVQCLTPKQQTKMLTVNKIWKNVRDERHKRGIDAENTPPHSFNSYPPEVVQSAPGKIRTKSNKTKWSNDSLII